MSGLDLRLLDPALGPAPRCDVDDESAERDHRILLLDEHREASFAGRRPSREAETLMFAILDGILQGGRSFESIARIGGRRGSHADTPAARLRRLRRPHPDEDKAGYGD